MRYPGRTAMALGIGGVIIVAGVFLLRGSGLGRAETWQRLASPGPLSAAHASLEPNCAACHTAAKGPDPVKCIACHATEESLLKRQPTAFHADVGSCRECHVEHQGRARHPTAMDHVALATIGLRRLKAGRRTGGGTDPELDHLLAWIERDRAAEHDGSGSPRLASQEAALDCATCHASKDRHLKLFGEDCARCHETSQWTIPEFRHPSPRSTDCAQCHQAPPSHYMEHFHMVSAVAAGHHEAKVNQCYLCHRTTSWNDIQGIGWYKHH